MLSTTDVLASHHDVLSPSSRPQESARIDADNGRRSPAFRLGMRVKLELIAGGEQPALVRWSKGGIADFTITS